MKASLEYKQGGSDKVYHVQIKEHGDPQDGAFTVDFQYGRRGSALATGTKTPLPVSLHLAESLFKKLVAEKKAKGYTETGAEASGVVGAASKEVDEEMLPQLLTEAAEADAERFITDDDYCAQEKLDGRNKSLRRHGSFVTSTNKKGQQVPTPLDVARAAVQIGRNFIVQAEHVGDVFYVHNITSLEGDDYAEWTYTNRMAVVTKLFPYKDAPIVAVETARTTQEKRDLFLRLKRENKEGIVFKKKYAPFRVGYTDSQFKIKFWASLSARVKRLWADGKSSIEVELLNPSGAWVTAGNVTVLKRGLIDTLKVGDVVEVKYLYALKSTGILYQPSPCMTGDTFKRDDVGWHECITKQLKLKGEL